MDPAPPSPLIDSSMIDRFRSIVTGPPPSDERAAGSVTFLLSAPRSGSTLLRVMLAGHSRLFVPPELELLRFASMDEREGALYGCRAAAGDGLLRALRSLLAVTPEAAQRWLQRTDAPKTTAEMYDRILALSGGRLLSTKPPPMRWTTPRCSA